MALIGPVSLLSTTISHPASVVNSAPTQIVKADPNLARSEQELSSIISANQAKHQLTNFITVSSPKAAHLFPPSAVIVRSQQALIIHSYDHTYVWSLSTPLFMSDTVHQQQIDLKSVPFVAAPMTDSLVTRLQFFATHASEMRTNASLCEDCLIFTKQLPRQRSVNSSAQTVTPAARIHPAISGAAASKGLSRFSPDVCDPLDFTNADDGNCATYYLQPGPPSSSSGGGSSATEAPGYFIALELRDVDSGENLAGIPFAGHSFIQLWYGAYPNIYPVSGSTNTLEGGNNSKDGTLDREDYGNGNNATSAVMTFMQPIGYNTIDMPNTSVFQVMSAGAVHWSNITNRPKYVVLTMNCNTFADGLLLFSKYFPASAVTQAFEDNITTAMNLGYSYNPQGFTYGSTIEQLF